MARFTDIEPSDEQRGTNAKALADAMRRGRDAALNAVTTEGSPAEWLAQQVAPGFKSTNTAGIYAKEPDLGAMAMGMAGPMKIGESPAFDRWFGKSKAVDAEGKPLTVFHGTNADVEAFDPARRGSATPDANAKEGFFFSDKPAEASLYAREAVWDSGRGADAYGAGARGAVMPVHLRMENPLRVEYAGSLDPDVLRNARAAGHDGVIDARGDYIAFEPAQIKSAIGNRGTFDPSDPNITHALPPLVGAAGLAEAMRRRKRSNDE